MNKLKDKKVKSKAKKKENSKWVVVKKEKKIKAKNKNVKKHKVRRDDEYNYIYLLQTHHSIDMKEDVYKIGKTTQQNIQRIRSYPKCSKLLLHLECKDCHESEKILLEKFRKEFIQIKKYGNEYFEGNCEDMKKIIISYIICSIEFDEQERKGFFQSIIDWFRK